MVQKAGILADGDSLRRNTRMPRLQRKYTKRRRQTGPITLFIGRQLMWLAKGVAYVGENHVEIVKRIESEEETMKVRERGAVRM